jgi:hypothetical protein
MDATISWLYPIRGNTELHIQACGLEIFYILEDPKPSLRVGEEYNHARPRCALMISTCPQKLIQLSC